MTIALKNSSGNTIASKSVDLPLETMVVDGHYDSQNKEIVLELTNGNSVRIPVGDLIAGLQTEITPSNKLSSDLVDDTNHIHKFVTTQEKTTWNNKAEASDIPTKVSDLTNDSGFITNSVNNLTNYYDKTYIDGQIGDIETILYNINRGSGV